MSEKLKAELLAALPGKVDVELNPVDSSDDKPKVYKLELNGEIYYDWVMLSGTVDVKLAPSDTWKTPLNYETHSSYFGPGRGEKGGEAKDEMYDNLKTAIEAKAKL